MKLSFTYLVKQDEKTWNDFSNSIFLLDRKILSKLSCDFDILLFCEGEPSVKARKIINTLKKKKYIKIKKKLISLKDYVKRCDKKGYIEKFPHAARSDLFTSLGYRDMCKFFSFDIFNSFYP